MLTEWPYSRSSELIFGSLCSAFRVLGLTLAEHRPTGPKPFQTPNKTIRDRIRRDRNMPCRRAVGHGPSPFGRVSRAPRAAQAPKMTDLRPLKKVKIPCQSAATFILSIPIDKQKHAF